MPLECVYAENAKTLGCSKDLLCMIAEAGKITGKESRINAISTHQNTASSNATELWTAARATATHKTALARL